ncbi:MAG TPA: ATP-binding protein [Steroidobacteraceae bacterium]
MHFGIAEIVEVNYRTGRLLPLAVALIGILLTGNARGDCVPLSSPELRLLDRLTDGDPERAVAQAERRLTLLPLRHDALVEAELYAVIAAARAQQGRSGEAHAAVLAAGHVLDTQPDSSGTQRLRDRLLMNDIESAETESNLRSAMQSITGIIARTPARSIEQLCALAARADLHAEHLELDLAAADGLAAYSQAEDAGLTEPRIQAAASLANTFRRSGLLWEAERMMDEVVQFERSENRVSQLAAAMYVRGQILIEGQRYGEARQTLESSRRLAMEVGDEFGASFTNVALCPALISAGDLDSAQQVCSASDSLFAAAGREDLVTLMLAYRARLDLARGQPQQALAKLDQVLGPRAAYIMSTEEPKIHLDYARALGALGQFDYAYRELAHSLELQRSLDLAQRSRAAAVLKVAYDAERRAARSRSITQRLWIAFAAAATLLSILFGCLLWSGHRHKRQLRRQQVVLQTVTSSAPDALLLLDRQRTVRFANRSTFGSGPTPAQGESLDNIVSSSMLGSLKAAVDQVFENRCANTFQTDFIDETGAVRRFELRSVPVIEDNELIGVTLCSMDITEIRRLEREVLDVVTSERLRLSSDMHEGLGQELTGISLLLKSVVDRIERGKPATSEELSEIMAFVSHTIGMTREIANGLSPIRIQRGSFAAALQHLAQESSRRLRLKITVDPDCDDIVVSEEVADHLYRIALEAITNAARHSGCSKIEISFRLANDGLHLSISDDGVGVRPKAVDADGMGLKMMAYRGRLIGGAIRFEARPGGGSQLIVVAPIVNGFSEPLATAG